MALLIKHNGKDITDKLDLTECRIYDKLGGTLDNITLAFPPDSNNITFDKNDLLEIKVDMFNSGKMWIDDCGSSEGIFRLNAVSCKQSNKIQKTNMWRSISLYRLAEDVARDYDLELKLYDVEDYVYDSIHQKEETDLQFLMRICEREGYGVKCENGRLIIFGEYRLENNPLKVLELKPSDIAPNWAFNRSLNGLSSFTLSYFDIATGAKIKATANDSTASGGSKSVVEYLKDVNEAERFAKGNLRKANKELLTGELNMPLKSNISAGTVLNLTDFEDFDGKYIVYEVVHDIVLNSTEVKIRNILAY